MHKPVDHDYLRHLDDSTGEIWEGNKYLMEISINHDHRRCVIGKITLKY